MISKPLLQTKALCTECSSTKLLPTWVVLKEGRVLLQRSSCPLCGPLPLTSLTTDYDYFTNASLLLDKIPADRKWTACVVELLDACNMSCPICIAGSAEGKGSERTFEECASNIAFFDYEAPGCELLLSGGEPTIHSRFLDLVLYASSLSFSKIIIVTNGLEVVKTPALSGVLAGLGSRVEVHLQFDALSRNALRALRGQDLRTLRIAALEILDRHAIPTTLVSVMARGLTDTLVSDIVKTVFKYECVVGFTFQPLRIGRAGNPRQLDTNLTMYDTMTLLAGEFEANASSWFGLSECAPFHFAFAFLSIIGSAWDALPKIEVKHDGLAFPNCTGKSTRIVRIGVLFHNDRATYFSGLMNSGLIGVASSSGSILSLDTYYLRETS